MADGSVTIDTGLGTKKLASDMAGVISKAKQFGKDFAKTLSTATKGSDKAIEQLTQKYNRQTEAIKRQEASIQKLEDRRANQISKSSADIDKQVAKVEQLKSKLDALGEGETSSKQFGSMERELAKSEKELVKLNSQFDELLNKQEQLREFAGIGISAGENADEIAKIDSVLEPLGEKIRELEARSESLREKIAQIKMNPQSTEEGEKLKTQLDAATAKLDQLRQASVNTGASLDRDLGLGADKLSRLTNEADATKSKLEQIQNEPRKVNSAFSGLTGTVKRFGSTLGNAFSKGIKLGGRFIKSLRNIGSRMSDVFKRTNKTSGAFDSLRKRMLSLITAAFVFNVIRKGLRELMDYMSAAMRTNQQYVNSLATIKGNLLTAFQPIYETIMPALNAFMSVLARVTAYIAAFVNLLFGKSVKASQDNAEALYNQAKGLDKVKDSAKKAANALAAFDEINVLQRKDDDDDGAGSDVIMPSFDYDYNGLEEWGSKAKEIIGNILDVFKKAWDNVGDYVIGGWNHALENVLGLAKDIATTLYEVWIDGHGQALVESFLTLLGTILYIIGDIAAAFREAWSTDGYAVVASFFDALTKVLNLLNSIGLAFRKAWNDGTGVSIAKNILQIFTNINKTISELAERIQEAWEANDNGVRIWNVILGVIDSVLATINRMAKATAEWAKSLNLEPLMTAFAGLLEAIQPVVDIILDGLGWAYENVLLPFGKWLIELAVPAALGMLEKAFNAIKTALDVLKPAATWIWENFLVPLGEWAGEKFLDALDFIGEKFDQVTKWMQENGEDINNVLEGIGKIAVFVWENVLKPVLDTVWETFKSVVDSIGQILGGLITFLSGVFTGDWEKAWNGIKQIFAGIWNGIVSILEGGINLIIRGINWLLEKLNSIHIEMPDWVEDMFGISSIGFNIPTIPEVSIPRIQVPALASGAIIPPNREFLARLGDQTHGMNVEAPASLIEDIVRQEVTAAISDLISALENQEITISNVLNLDGEVVYSNQQQVSRRHGTNLIAGRI